MSAKKKMIIAISSFAMVLLAAVVAVVAVLAAQNVAVKSSLTVKYSVTDVVADVQVYATMANTGDVLIEDYWNKDEESLLGSLTFEVGEGSPLVKSVDAKDFELEHNTCVILKFVFNNNSASKAFTATLTAPTAPTNTVICYAAAANSLMESTTTSPAAVSVSAGSSISAEYYAVIKIDDPASDVPESSIAFNWTLA